MAKIVKLEPISEETEVRTNENILCALLQKELNVLQECQGRGLCSTCHVYITGGMESLSPLNRREQRTLEIITTTQTNSRLACQARVIGEGVVVELPVGMYVNAIENLEASIGTRTKEDILHPLNGKVLVQAGKLITRSVVNELQSARLQVKEHFARIRES